MNSPVGDLQFGVRMLARNPRITLTAIATLALRSGANAAIFTVTSALLLRPLRYRDPQQLVSLEAKSKTTDFGGTLLRYELLRDRIQSFESIAAWTDDNANLTGSGEPQQVPLARVSANFFSMLGVQPHDDVEFALQSRYARSDYLSLYVSRVSCHRCVRKLSARTSSTKVDPADALRGS